MHASHIVHLFNELVAQLSAFAVHIDGALSAYPMWVWQGQELVGSRELIKEAFTTLSYEEGECGQSTLSCPGALPGTEQTLAWIASINALKDRLQHVNSNRKLIHFL